jgi:hypothetical protein
MEAHGVNETGVQGGKVMIFPGPKTVLFSLLILVLASGCGSGKGVARQDDLYRQGYRQAAPVTRPQSGATLSRREPSTSATPRAGAHSPVTSQALPRSVPDTGLKTRVITEREIQSISARDPDLSPSVIRHVLSRINAKAAYYIEDDIRDGRPLIVPNDLGAYKKWSPMDPYIPDIAEVPKLILIVKDEYFLGWYEGGRLVGDSHVCIGRQDDWTRAGVYAVRDKDPDHISRSYTNAYGEPALMPWALRIYEHVWIHAGDITQGNCSHGCINLPVFVAPKVFEWADKGTAVVIVDSMEDVEPVLAENRSNCLLFARTCRMKQARAAN